MPVFSRWISSDERADSGGSLKEQKGMDRVKSAVIGAGQYGTAVIVQQFSASGIEVKIAADLDAEKALRAYREAGIPAERIVYAAGEGEARAALASGKYVYTDRPEIVFGIEEIDVICDSTGNPETGARVALNALEAGKNLVCVGKEADSAVGPFLRREFEKKGLIYSAADGDQHGLLVQLVKWARALGLTVVAGGKFRDGELVCNSDLSEVRLWNFKTSILKEDRKWIRPFEGDIPLALESRKRVLSALPGAGGYDLCELCIAANYTGLKPICAETVQPPLHLSEVASVFSEREHGGILGGAGYIDMVQNLRGERDAETGGGVFVVVRAENPRAQAVLVDKTGGANKDGSACLLSRPYHLCGLETVASLIRAGRGIDGTDGLVLGLGDGKPEEKYRQRYDLVRLAKRPIHKGEIFGGDHSDFFDTRILPAAVRSAYSPVPAHLLTGNAAAAEIRAGELVTYAHVLPPRDSALWELRARLERETEVGLRP